MSVPPSIEHYNLTQDQKKSYEQQGFLVIEDFFTPEEHATFKAYTEECKNWKNEKGKWMQYYEVNKTTNEEQLCRTEFFTPYHDGLRSYVRSPRLMTLLNELLDEEYILFKEKINYKLPGGGAFVPHQDCRAFTQFGQNTHMTVMFTVDSTTDANGCLEVVPGSHANSYENGLLPHATNEIHPDWVNEQKWTPVYLKPGSILIFGAYLAHRSGDNNTDESRVAIYLTYNALKEGDSHARYYQDKRDFFPPEYEREEGKDYSSGAKIYNYATPIKM
ncbi:PhyH-domain-containing protein [Hesseltinella vesiculosa]|uniref:PhyH-domain-containing protein n=1 Tax=Hesseltinella vesiculosa TaxID=101127 RepID=A0A1X2GSS2_9FUNG|nr:PhyH-domain-containing protein [Hesseltinella vesiculosa]